MVAAIEEMSALAPPVHDVRPTHLRIKIDHEHGAAGATPGERARIWSERAFRGAKFHSLGPPYLLTED